MTPGPCSLTHPAFNEPSFAHTVPDPSKIANSGPFVGSLATAIAVTPGPCSLTHPAFNEPSFAHTVPDPSRYTIRGPFVGSLATATAPRAASQSAEPIRR